MKAEERTVVEEVERYLDNLEKTEEADNFQPESLDKYFEVVAEVVLE